MFPLRCLKSVSGGPPICLVLMDMCDITSVLFEFRYVPDNHVVKIVYIQ